MSFEERIEKEKTILGLVVDGILKTFPDYTITVYDGEAYTVSQSRNKDAIVGALMTVDEDYLIVNRESGLRFGWVRFVYGNDGYDVVNDYTTNLEEAMAMANMYVDKYM